MKHALIFALAGAVTLSGAALAETTKADVAADVKAIHKDNAAIEKQEDNLDTNRAEKAEAKANGDVLKQASESVQIGANKTAITAKKAEKHVDKKILEHDKKEMEEDKAK